MKYKVQFLFYFLGVSVLCLKVCAVFAKAPDTAKIVFAKGGIENTRDIYLMNIDGSDQTNLTDHRADDIAPVWSPTGEHILFASDREHKAWGTWDLYLMDSDGSHVRKVFDKWKRRTSPTWSIEAQNISRLCEKYRGKYTAPSDFYFGDIDCVFSPFKDAEIDLTVLRVESEVAQEDFDKKQKERGHQKPVTPQSLAYQSPLVRRDNDDDDAW